jgi:hypothetical protein
MPRNVSSPWQASDMDQALREGLEGLEAEGHTGRQAGRRIRHWGGQATNTVTWPSTAPACPAATSAPLARTNGIRCPCPHHPPHRRIPSACGMSHSAGSGGCPAFWRRADQEERLVQAISVQHTCTCMLKRMDQDLTDGLIVPDQDDATHARTRQAPLTGTPLGAVTSHRLPVRHQHHRWLVMVLTPIVEPQPHTRSPRWARSLRP